MDRLPPILLHDLEQAAPALLPPPPHLLPALELANPLDVVCPLVLVVRLPVLEDLLHPVVSPDSPRVASQVRLRVSVVVVDPQEDLVS